MLFGKVIVQPEELAVIPVDDLRIAEEASVGGALSELLTLSDHQLLNAVVSQTDSQYSKGAREVLLHRQYLELKGVNTALVILTIVLAISAVVQAALLLVAYSEPTSRARSTRPYTSSDGSDQHRSDLPPDQ